MSTTEIILIVIAFIALGFSLYRRYIRKNQGAKDSRPDHGSGLLSSQDDDYEPYSKGKSQDWLSAFISGYKVSERINNFLN